MFLAAVVAMVAVRPSVNVADHGGRIDNSPSADIEVTPGGRRGR